MCLSLCSIDIGTAQKRSTTTQSSEIDSNEMLHPLKRQMERTFSPIYIYICMLARAPRSALFDPSSAANRECSFGRLTGMMWDLAAKLEYLGAVQQGAWHALSILLLAMFMSDCNCNSSNWKNWWDMCNRILETRGSFRACYIVLLMLQHIQKLNGNRKIKDLKVWTQELVHLVKQKLVEWSNFPEAMVLELLEC